METRRKKHRRFYGAKGFNLLINDTLVYQLQFGDGTSDAHKNAKTMHLFYETQQTGSYYAYTLMLRKE